MLRAALLVAGCLLLARCHVYDEKVSAGKGSSSAVRAEADSGRAPLIDEPATSTPASDEGPVPDGPAPRAPRSDDDAGSAEPPSRSSVPRCGDGEVNGAEKCDPGIPDGQQGACPRACPSLEACVPRVLNGSGCQAECVLREVSCQGGDQCCPGKCTKENDSDCSAKCGDGLVQESQGETCEPEGDTPCLRSAAQCDDGDPCTQDSLMGSPANCNTRCAHLASRDAKAGDGCCPEGASANNDNDCKPRCGNNVREAGEACDGGPGCEPDCKQATASDLQRCTESAKNDCERCACVNCTGTEVACRMGPQAESNTLCGGVIGCMHENECVGNPLASCYCGTTLICGLPYGACKMQVEAAGKSTDFEDLYDTMSDRNTPLGRAASADLCRITRCLSECR